MRPARTSIPDVRFPCVDPPASLLRTPAEDVPLWHPPDLVTRLELAPARMARLEARAAASSRGQARLGCTIAAGGGVAQLVRARLLYSLGWRFESSLPYQPSVQCQGQRPSPQASWRSPVTAWRDTRTGSALRRRPLPRSQSTAQLGLAAGSGSSLMLSTNASTWACIGVRSGPRKMVLTLFIVSPGPGRPIIQ